MLQKQIGEAMKQLLLTCNCVAGGFILDLSDNVQTQLGDQILRPYLQEIPAEDKDRLSAQLENRQGVNSF
jgi:hypothetical protein